ncbi:hypothetical protein P0D72_11000 [Paraburkholderia sediminicola]|uniref:hypothetical protein n=1 Tax=Paraburkholderia sediminicola TaxID=458836 RepID=UPI0038BA7015
MGRSKANYGTAELEFVKRHVADILTVSQKDVSVLARLHSEEVTKVVTALQPLAAELHHKWAGAVLAKLPASVWDDSDGPMRIRSGSAASMRFLSNDVDEREAEEAEKLLDARQELMTRLLEEMPSTYRVVYREMLRWVPAQAHPSPNLARFPLGGDTAFGHRLSGLEELFDYLVCLDEQIWRRRRRPSDDTSTPCEVTRKAVDDNLRTLKDTLDFWWQTAVDKETAPDSFLARISANISVNRALLEYASSDERGSEAAEMTVTFLDALNSRDLVEVPIEVDRWTPADEQQQLTGLLHRWFGCSGLVIEKGGYFSRPMYPSDIETVVAWSVELRHRYKLGRGARGGSENANKAHGRPYDLFLFALTMAGCFFARTTTDLEFKMGSNRRYAVFPARGERRHTPPAHAAQVLMEAYGMILFANRAHELNAARVREYAQTARITRASLQQLLAYAVKKRTSGELLVLFDRLAWTRQELVKALSHPASGPDTIPVIVGAPGSFGTSILFAYSMLNKLWKPG